MMLVGISALAAILFGLLVVCLGGRNPPAKAVGEIRVFVGMLEDKSIKNSLGEKVKRFCDKNGAMFHYGRHISPLRLFGVSAVLFSGGWIAGLRLGTVFFLPAAILLGSLPWVLLPILNKSDNEKMLPELRVIYHALAMQIRAGVHVSEALSEMYEVVKFPRLREAFMRLGSDIILKSDMFSALEAFQMKFDNRYIDSLCITVLQSMESGQATELLGDIGDQLKDMEKMVLEKRKGRLDRSLTFYQLGMLSCVLVVALYACVSYMLSTAVSMN
ncbi:MAG: type II secretion system F family protein [Lachnospiraceae bacterium]|nr:type II secretion system F family protein [Lachnospiraceae bacterium]